MRGAVAEAGTVGEEGVVQQGAAVGLADGVHLFHEAGKLAHVKLVHLLELPRVLDRVVRHLALDGADGLDIFAEFLPVGMAEAAA